MIFFNLTLSIFQFFDNKFPLDECKTTKGEQCIFPWVNGGKSISHCVKQGSKYWCGTELKANNQYKKWGWCNDDCPNSDTVTTTTASPPGFALNIHY